MQVVSRTPLSQFDSLIVPIVKYLKDKGVKIQCDTVVTDLDVAEAGEGKFKATGFTVKKGGKESKVQMGEQDIFVL